jgi:hypothetical protein
LYDFLKSVIGFHLREFVQLKILSDCRCHVFDSGDYKHREGETLAKEAIFVGMFLHKGHTEFGCK